MRTGSLAVEKLLQQVRHRAAAATPLAAGVATSGVATSRAATTVATTAATTVATTVAIGGGAAGREHVQQPAQEHEAGGPQEEEGHEAPSVAQLVEVACGEGRGRQSPRYDAIGAPGRADRSVAWSRVRAWLGLGLGLGLG